MMLKGVSKNMQLGEQKLDWCLHLRRVDMQETPNLDKEFVDSDVEVGEMNTMGGSNK